MAGDAMTTTYTRVTDDAIERLRQGVSVRLVLYGEHPPMPWEHYSVGVWCDVCHLLLRRVFIDGPASATRIVVESAEHATRCPGPCQDIH